MAGGYIWRDCAAGVPATHLLVGFTGYLSNLSSSSSSLGAGGGVEAEVNWRVSSALRLGPRAGVETAPGGSALLTMGGRLRMGAATWFGVDGIHLTSKGCAYCASSTGVMVGFGFSGVTGTAVAATEAVGVGVLVGILAAIFSNLSD